ncbi:alpha/beta fold hydrolase [Streptomyces sp. NPDC050560]|uniref:alpha/beta fold hydrolase n=1 Tax=Streptomyces sp. NPDC050560 TaxID=3365630 RepID=UPI00378ACB17
MAQGALDAVAATLYTPLYARAHADELAPEAGLHDPAAAALLAEAEARAVAAGTSLPGILRDRGNGGGSVWRTVIFDGLTREFCRRHPDALVVSAGIGLCTRRRRLTAAPGDPVADTVEWVGVDVPEVIELRRRAMPDDATTLVPASLADRSWADGIEAGGRPVLVLAEGVVMYFDEPGLAGFLGGAYDRFGPGTELVADYFHPKIALSGRHPIVRATGAQFRSGARNGREFAAKAPGWSLDAEYEVMERISAAHRAAASAFRLLTRGSRPYSIARLTATAAATRPDGAPGAAGHTQGEREWVVLPDGRRLFAQVLPGPEDSPDGAPTVVFEAGSGATRSSWARVQPPTARYARAVVYDRAGLGRSDPDPRGRTMARMAQDLADLLDHVAAGSGRFVLVGHSAGGPVVRLAASLRPELVAGLVLVDPTDEATGLLFGRTFRVGEKVVLRVNLALARVGLLRPLYRGLLRAMPADDVRGDLAAEGFTTGLVRTQIEQCRTYLDDLKAFRATPPPLGDIPVTVVSGARTGAGMNKRVRSAANAAHAERAAASPGGRHVVAPGSGHYVPLTDPGLVVAEIARLVTGAAGD